MSDLKRCREAFEKIYPEDSGDRFDRVLYDKWLMFKAGWYASRRADDDWLPIDRQKLIDILIKHELDWAYGNDDVIGQLADKILKAMRPLPNPPQPPRSMDEGDMARDLQQETES